MPISSKTLAALAFAVSLLGLPGPEAWAGARSFDKAPAAATLIYEEGMRAYNQGDMAQAISLLRDAADQGVFLSQYYLARIYSARGERYANRAEAYQLYKRIAADNADSDPQMNIRAPFVARSELELARYLQTGIPELDLVADAAAARDHLVRAAQIFGDADAQFDLAKLDLDSPDTRRAGLDLLSNVAVRRGHPGAMVLLSQLYLTGEYVGQVRPDLAFAYANLAVENAPDADRIWTEENFQGVFCQTTLADRELARSLMLKIRGESEETPYESSEQVEEVNGRVTWRCSDGERVASPASGKAKLPAQNAVDTPEADAALPAASDIAGATGANKSYRPAGNLPEGMSGFVPLGLTLDKLEAPGGGTSLSDQ